MRNKKLIGAVFIIAVIAVAVAGMWRTHSQRAEGYVATVVHPQGVMGTTCTLAAVVPRGETVRSKDAVRLAEAELRAVEAGMSTWLADSELSRLNAAGAGERVPLSPETLEVLHAAREAALRTDGAFDATCRPLVELWKRAGLRDRLPTEGQIDDARTTSHWDLIEFTDRGAVKHVSATCVDLGGIAKGYAIDRAIAALQEAGMAGGLVDVGGDLACFGRWLEGQPWSVDVKDPFREGALAKLSLPGGAVCTSGAYARFAVIEGMRYSHIIDPRSGRPADAAASVTVTAKTAMTADVWATALSVLGIDGLRLLPANVEALMILGSAEDHRLVCTPGFRDLLQKPLPDPEGLTVWEAAPAE